MTKRLGIPLFELAYAGYLITLLLRYRDVLLDRTLLATAISWLGLSAGMDVAASSFGTPSPVQIEGTLKFVGIVTWSLYWPLLPAGHCLAKQARFGLFTRAARWGNAPCNQGVAGP